MLMNKMIIWMIITLNVASFWRNILGAPCLQLKTAIIIIIAFYVIYWVT